MLKLVKITEDLVLLNYEADDKKVVLTKMADLLFRANLVKETYSEAIQKRESVFPTGLPTEEIGVAIPHTDSVHVNESSMAVAILKNPVKFEVMGSPGTFVDVKIVMMLAIKDNNTQLYLLKNLMDLFRNKALLNNIVNSKSKKEVVELINSKLNV